MGRRGDGMGRKGDGRRRRGDGGEGGEMRVGATAEGAVVGLALRPLADSHPPPNLPPGRGEG